MVVHLMPCRQPPCEREPSNIKARFQPDGDSSSSSPPSSSGSSHSSASTSFPVDTFQEPVPSQSPGPELGRSKGVRFLIQSHSSKSQTIQTIFMPQDDTAEVPKFGSGSKWKKSHLDMLNVEYDPQAHSPFTFDSVPMPPALHTRITSSPPPGVDCRNQSFC